MAGTRTPVLGFPSLWWLMCSVGSSKVSQVNNHTSWNRCTCDFHMCLEMPPYPPPTTHSYLPAWKGRGRVAGLQQDIPKSRGLLAAAVSASSGQREGWPPPAHQSHHTLVLELFKWSGYQSPLFYTTGLCGNLFCFEAIRYSLWKLLVKDLTR